MTKDKTMHWVNVLGSLTLIVLILGLVQGGYHGYYGYYGYFGTSSGSNPDLPQVEDFSHENRNPGYQGISSFSSPGVNTFSESNIKLSPPSKGIYQGAYTDFGGGENRVSAQKILEFENTIGKKIVWAVFSNNWGSEGITFPEENVKTINELGVVPFIRIMPRINFQEGEADPVYGLQSIIDGKFDDSLRKWATDAKKMRIPIMVEFGTEVNGDWFPWSGILNGGGNKDGYGDPYVPDGPERFKDAYRHIIDLFREEGVENITWCFHVFTPGQLSDNEELRKSWNDVDNYYPGDKYIDWIGVSVYGSVEPDSVWKTFSQIFDKDYPIISSISAKKPVAIFEWGTAEGPHEWDKTEWIKSALQSLQDGRYPRIKAISYWNEKWKDDITGKIIDLRIDSSTKSTQLYKLMLNSSFFLSEAEFHSS